MEPCNFGFAFIHFCALYVSPSGQQKVAWKTYTKQTIQPIN
jgi:hypothetical protein